MQTLPAAFKYLTIWHFFAAPPDPHAIGRAAKYFPAVGLVVGLILALANYLLNAYLHSEILSVVLTALLVVLTGGLHLQGLGATFGGLGASAAGMHSISGVTAVTLVLLLKSAAVESIDERLTLSLLLTPVLARWALLVFLYGDPTQFDDECHLIAKQVTFTQLFAVTLAMLAFVTYFLGRGGLWIALAVSLTALIARRSFQLRAGMLTDATAGAVVEIEEALSLILLARF